MGKEPLLPIKYEVECFGEKKNLAAARIQIP
jgi:hypothetical protein